MGRKEVSSPLCLRQVDQEHRIGTRGGCTKWVSQIYTDGWRKIGPFFRCGAEEPGSREGPPLRVEKKRYIEVGDLIYGHGNEPMRASRQSEESEKNVIKDS